MKRWRRKGERRKGSRWRRPGMGWDGEGGPTCESNPGGDAAPDQSRDNNGPDSLAERPLCLLGRGNRGSGLLNLLLLLDYDGVVRGVGH